MSKQRVVLVTGGMGGLGETISTKMVDAGYKVAVTYSPGNKTHGEWVAQMKRELDNPTAADSDEPEEVLDQIEVHMPATAGSPGV